MIRIRALSKILPALLIAGSLVSCPGTTNTPYGNTTRANAAVYVGPSSVNWLGQGVTDPVGPAQIQPGVKAFTTSAGFDLPAGFSSLSANLTPNLLTIYLQNSTGEECSVRQDVNIAIEDPTWDGGIIHAVPASSMPDTSSRFVTNDSINILIEQGTIVPRDGLELRFDLDIETVEDRTNHDSGTEGTNDV